MSARKIDIDGFAFAVFVLLIFSLAFMKPAVAVGFSALTPTDLLFLIVVVAFVLALFIGGARLRWWREYWAFGAFFFALLISAAFSTNAKASFSRLLVPGYLISLAMVTSSLLTTARRLRITVYAWLAGASIAVLLAVVAVVVFYIHPGSELLQFFLSHSGAVPVGNFARVESTFVSPSMLCNFLSVTAIVALAARTIGWIGRVTAAVLLVATTIAAVFTFSIALGGFFLAVGIWIWFESGNNLTGRVALLAAGSIAVVSLAIAPFALPADLWSGDIVPTAESSRLMVWRASVNTLLAHPITGIGIGLPPVEIVFQNYDGSRSLLTDAHNTFLSLTAQAGILGLAGLLVLIAAVSRSAFSRCSDSGIGKLRLGLGFAFFVAFVFEGLTGSFEDARHLWVLIGFIIAANNLEESTSLNCA